jgi:hypothetical protein
MGPPVVLVVTRVTAATVALAVRPVPVSAETRVATVTAVTVALRVMVASVVPASRASTEAPE